MDNKRLFLATIVSFLILIGWQFFAEYMGWMPEPQPVVQEARDIQDPAVPSAQMAGNEADPFLADAESQSAAPRFAPSDGREVRVETPLYTAVFHSGGGVLKSFTLKKYNDVVGPDAKPLNLISPQAASVSPMGLLVNGQPSWSSGTWSADVSDVNIAEGQSGNIVFTGDMHGITITRNISFHSDTYLMDETVSLSTDGAPQFARLGFNLAVSPLAGSSNQDAMLMAWNDSGSLDTENSQKKLTNEGIMTNGNLYWAGVMSNYFLAAAAPAQTAGNVYKARIVEGEVWRGALEVSDLSLAPGAPASAKTSWWFGPKDRDLLSAAPNELSDAIDLGWFSFISVPLLWLLKFFQSYVGNWGVAIILLTLVVKILFWPLTRKSYKSMEKMKKLQPMIQQLQEKHGKDKEAVSREMMQLYKTYGVNPMGGCLPILIQLPVFVALYRALMFSIDLRHASFITHLPFTDMLWLADLSVKDPFYITPIIMGATMFLQQWLSPAVGDPNQRKMMMIMPLVFTFMFVNFPAGLVVYWLCNNVFSIIQQWWTLRKA